MTPLNATAYLINLLLPANHVIYGHSLVIFWLLLSR